jgi:hypothetical protein
MAQLTPVAISKLGIADITASLVAATALGDSVDAASGLIIAVSNGDASPHTLTVPAPSASASCSNLGDLTVDPLTLVVAAGDIGLLAIPLGYADGQNLAWTYDAVTSVTVGVYSIAP